MLRIILSGSILLSLVACSTPDNRAFMKVRGISLEGNVRMISIVLVPKEDVPFYKQMDTVWVNLDTHKVDDTCTTAMAYALDFQY